VHDEILLFGGGANVTVTNDTWIWDGNTWIERTPSQAPSPRLAFGLAYDPGIQRVVLFGGEGCYPCEALGDTWIWDGSTWTKLEPPHTPKPRFYSSMTYDPQLGQIVLFGGVDGLGGELLSDTWTFDGHDWTELYPLRSPSARYGTTLASRPGTGEIVLFGGVNDQYLNDTWVFKRGNWARRFPSVSPSPGVYHAMAGAADGDPAIVMFGGQDGAPLADSWVWNGTTWKQVIGPGPDARQGSVFVADPRTGSVLMFGGWSVDAA
jgi:hypothetical protein